MSGALDQFARDLRKKRGDSADLFQGIRVPVLDKGYVAVIDVMGFDEDIVAAARTSYVQDAHREERPVGADRRLIRRLYRDQHTSPFEMVELKLQIKLPMDVHRQLVRHRTASLNEYSTRYRPAVDDMHATAPTMWRVQSTNNKQGSAGYFSAEEGEAFSREEAELHEHARRVYQRRLDAGMAREQARKDLPLSNYTVIVWKIDGNNLLKFLRLRMDEHAQWEIRQYANAIYEIAKVWLPLTIEAFDEYTRGIPPTDAMG